MIDNHEDRITNLENNMTIDYGQQRERKEQRTKKSGLMKLLSMQRTGSLAQIQ